MDPSQWRMLAEHFCPKVYLCAGDKHYGVIPINAGDKTEDYLPSSIDWYLERADLMKKGEQEPVKDEVTEATLGKYSGPEHTSYYVQPKSPSATRRGDISTAAMYVHVRAVPGQSDQVDLQYWFFYPYNGSVDAYEAFGIKNYDSAEHEADWEHATVRVSDYMNPDPSSWSIVQIYFAAHSNEGKWRTTSGPAEDPSVYTLEGGSHVQVYSAWHSHASYCFYSSEGIERPVDVAGLGPIDWTGNGQSWGPFVGTNLPIVSVDSSLCGNDCPPNAPWFPFSGQWGRDGDSPWSPPVQCYWFDDPAAKQCHSPHFP